MAEVVLEHPVSQWVLTAMGFSARRRETEATGVYI